MSFLYGRTTWGSWSDKFLDLISGTSTDDQGNTCSVADRWRVRFDVGTSAFRAIAPPASTDELITQEHRQGYWGRYDDCCIYKDGSASGQDFMRQKSVWTSWHASFLEWLIVTVRVTTANTTVGNYSTARVALYAMGVNKAGGFNPIASNTVLTPAADGTCTYTYTTGYTMTFQIGNAATGKVTVDSFYVRSFSAMFPGGVDWWRRAGRNVDAAYEFTAGNTPAGIAGTDYIVNIGPLKQAWSGNITNNGSFTSYMASKFVGNWGASVQSAGTTGLGLVTNAALTGDRYEVSFTKNEACAYVYSDPTTLGYFYLTFGGVGQSLDGSFMRGVEGELSLATSSAFLYAPPANLSSVVQYWISVTATHIAVVLNVEGASGWNITGNLYAKVVQDDPSYGTCWMRGYRGNTLYWNRNGANYLIERAMQQGKGFYDGGRDWQTGQGRLDTYPLDYWSSWNSGDWGATEFYSVQYPNLYMLNHGGTSSSGPLPIVPWNISAANAPLADTRWRLVGFSLMDAASSGVTDTVAGAVGKYAFRGFVAEGMYQTPANTFNHGDELTDTTTGDKYLLWNSNANTFPSYGPESASIYPGIVLEEK